MNSQKTIYRIASITGLLLGASVLSAFATTGWTPAPSAPPAENVPAPINVGFTGNTIVQQKLDSLVIDGTLGLKDLIFKPAGVTVVPGSVLKAKDSNGTVEWGEVTATGGGSSLIFTDTYALTGEVSSEPRTATINMSNSDVLTGWIGGEEYGATYTDNWRTDFTFKKDTLELTYAINSDLIAHHAGIVATPPHHGTITLTGTPYTIYLRGENANSTIYGSFSFSWNGTSLIATFDPGDYSASLTVFANRFKNAAGGSTTYTPPNWTNVPLTDTADFDTSCEYRFRVSGTPSYPLRAPMTSTTFLYPAALSTDALIYTSHMDVLSYILKGSKNRYDVSNYNGSGSTVTGAYTVTLLQKRCGTGGASSVLPDFEFGGLYFRQINNSNTWICGNTNPYTNACTCPTGYEAKRVWSWNPSSTEYYGGEAYQYMCVKQNKSQE